MNKSEIILSAKRLFLFASILIMSLTVIYFGAKNKIEIQRQKALLATFQELSPETKFSTEFLKEKMNENWGDFPVKIYRENALFFIETSTFKGYSGEIALLIGIDGEKKALLGVRVLHHKETAGLGDKIEIKKSNWILSFNQKDLKTKFAVKKDGGEFDAFTGATITPRAITNHVGLIFHLWHKNHQE